MYNLNHIHLKSNDPEKTARWWVETFGFEIVDDSTRETGDRFIKCRSGNGIPVNIILMPLEGDPSAAAVFWQLAQYTQGSFLTPSKDWP